MLICLSESPQRHRSTWSELCKAQTSDLMLTLPPSRASGRTSSVYRALQGTHVLLMSGSQCPPWHRSTLERVLQGTSPASLPLLSSGIHPGVMLQSQPPWSDRRAVHPNLCFSCPQFSYLQFQHSICMALRSAYASYANDDRHECLCYHNPKAAGVAVCK